MKFQIMIAQTVRISAITLASVGCLTIISGSFLPANAQQPASNRLPILLIHGYGEDYSIWSSWTNWLRADHFNMTKVYSINFTNDECGSVVQHATELTNIVNRILDETHSDKVNIVAHSKGGLDARWYIAHDNDKVANLNMIGTPNSGTTAAFWQYYGCPVGSDFDLFQGSQATQAADSQSTHYYTVAGDYAVPCFLVSPIPFASCYLLPNDGFVTVHSAQCSYDHCYTSLVARPLPYNHEGLLTQKDVYDKILPILSSGH
ncbi:MAG: alpha/beta fold hydrolase [Candidatus Nitrosopolaris sp.]